jgi:hypothetical protein
MVDRVTEHCRLFNDAVRRGDWSSFAATFERDAIMRFEGGAAGPYVGRDAIAAAYLAGPPPGTMTVTPVECPGKPVSSGAPGGETVRRGRERP